MNIFDSRMVSRSVCALAILLVGATSVFGDVFNDGFEGASIDPFWATSNDAVISNASSHTGSNSLLCRNQGGASVQASISKTWTNFEQGSMSIWFYDDLSFTSADSSIMVRDSSLAAGLVGSSWRLTALSGKYYGYNGAAYTPGPTRSVGWHQFSMTVNSAQALLSVDGNTVLQTPGSFRFKLVKVYNNTSGLATRWDDFHIETLGGVASVPEPSSILALATMFPFGVMAFRRRK